MTITAASIGRVLEKAAYGQSHSEVFGDWLELCEASLTMLPVHAESVSVSGQMAEDSPETKAVFERVRARYTPERFAFLSEALALLLTASVEGYQDLIGEVFMQFANPNPGSGQFFTPFHLARTMAEMLSAGCVELAHERLKAAIRMSPLAEALAVAGSVLDGESAHRWLFSRVLPAYIEHYEPVKVSDPACGSGVMLLAHASTMPAWMVQSGLIQYYGMDIDRRCVQMARINTMLYGLNGYGARISCALDASYRALEQLQAPYNQLYAEAKAADESGRPEQVEAIAEDVRGLQLGLFAEAALAQA